MKFWTLQNFYSVIEIQNPATSFIYVSPLKYFFSISGNLRPLAVVGDKFTLAIVLLIEHRHKCFKDLGAKGLLLSSGNEFP